MSDFIGALLREYVNTSSPGLQRFKSFPSHTERDEGNETMSESSLQPSDYLAAIFHGLMLERPLIPLRDASTERFSCAPPGVMVRLEYWMLSFPNELVQQGQFVIK